MRFVWAFVFLIFSFAVRAQTPFFENAPTGTSLTTTFDGTPAILIEKSQVERPTINQAEKLPPPKWNNEIQLPITTPFGHKRTASFIDHITDFVAFITLLDAQTVRMEETIQFINTKPDNFFKWSLPENAELISFYHNKVKINPDEQDHILTLSEPLSQGVEQFTMTYLLHYPLKKSYALSHFMIPITSSKIPLMTERFSIVLELPQKTPLYTNEVLFGPNNQKIPEQVLIKDAGKDVVYQMTHPLPAFSEVKLHVELDSLSLAPIQTDNTAIFVCLAYTAILILYTLLSIWVARHKKWKKILTHALKIDTTIWKAEMNKSKRIYHYIRAYFKFNWSYVLEILILLIVSHWLLQKYGFNLSIMYRTYLIFISVISLILIDQYGTKISLQNLKKAFYAFLMTTPQGLNLTNRVFKSCYHLARCLGFADAWREKIIRNNPAYQSYFQEEEKK